MSRTQRLNVDKDKKHGLQALHIFEADLYREI